MWRFLVMPRHSRDLGCEWSLHRHCERSEEIQNFARCGWVASSRSLSSGAHRATRWLLAITAWLLPSRQLLCGLAEHILSRLLVERLFFEFADRKPRLHLRPGAHLGVPALDVGIIVEREALCFM